METTERGYQIHQSSRATLSQLAQGGGQGDRDGSRSSCASARRWACITSHQLGGCCLGEQQRPGAAAARLVLATRRHSPPPSHCRPCPAALANAAAALSLAAASLSRATASLALAAASPAVDACLLTGAILMGGSPSRASCEAQERFVHAGAPPRHAAATVRVSSATATASAWREGLNGTETRAGTSGAVVGPTF